MNFQKRKASMLSRCVAICLVILVCRNLNWMCAIPDTSHTPNNNRVAFSVPGMYVPVEDALDLNFPFQLEEKKLEEPLPRARASTADNALRLFVAVTTACCQHISMSRRNGIRGTWLSISRATAPNADVVFFLAQARNSSVLEEWLPMLKVRCRQNQILSLSSRLSSNRIRFPQQNLRSTNKNNNVTCNCRKKSTKTMTLSLFVELITIATL